MRLVNLTPGSTPCCSNQLGQELHRRQKEPLLFCHWHSQDTFECEETQVTFLTHVTSLTHYRKAWKEKKGKRKANHKRKISGRGLLIMTKGQGQHASSSHPRWLTAPKHTNQLSSLPFVLAHKLLIKSIRINSLLPNFHYNISEDHMRKWVIEPHDTSGYVHSHSETKQSSCLLLGTTAFKAHRKAGIAQKLESKLGEELKSKQVGAQICPAYKREAFSDLKNAHLGNTYCCVPGPPGRKERSKGKIEFQLNRRLSNQQLCTTEEIILERSASFWGQ